MKSKYILQFFLSALLITYYASSLSAWGPGHDHVNHFAVDYLPQDIKEFLNKENCKKIIKWSHAPDDHSPWEKIEKKYMPFSEKEKQILAKHNLKKIYSLHSHKGQAANLILLTEAFKDKKPARAAFWAACLLHTNADEAACNHDPLVHYMTYHLSSMKFGKGVGFDFANLAKSAKGKEIIHKLLKNYKPTAISDDPQEALTEVMLGALKANSFMTQHGRRIAASYSKNASDVVRQDSKKAMAELGCYGVKHGNNAIVTAWEFAKAGKTLELTDDLLKNYHKASKKFMAERPIENDSLFTEFVKLPVPTKPYVGFLIEPSISMASSKFSTAAKIILSTAMRSMHQANRPFRAIDYRTLQKTELPSATEMPVLVIDAKRHFGLSKAVKNRIKNYCNNGGKLLWIGGTHGNMLGEFSKHMISVDNRQVPVSYKYGKRNSDIIAKSIISFDGPLKKIMGEKDYKFTHDPETRAGWMKPACNVIIQLPNKQIQPLATLTLDGKQKCIVATWLDETRSPKYIFLPEYLVAPFLFANVNTVENPANLELDEFTKKVFFGCLDILF